MPSVNRAEDFRAQLARDATVYFLNEVNHANGLAPDNTQMDSPASISATGFALAAYVAATKQSLLMREEARARTLTTLRFFATSIQCPEPDATGYQGFYYHFLDRETGRRARNSELSTIDTAILLAGVLTAQVFFDDETDDENEIRTLADQLYSRANWRWALNDGATVTHGWTPETGFLQYRWEGYCEAILLYLLALGSPTYPVSAECYAAWVSTYQWRNVYGYELVHAGPLFIHQLTHAWIDFRGIQDSYMRTRRSDYFQNSRIATYVQREYATRNPREFSGYDQNCWGVTASDGPGPVSQVVNGRTTRFFGYDARGVPDGPDDGTIAPWAVAASLPFAPEIVLPALQHMSFIYPGRNGPYGMKSSFNLTYSDDDGEHWVSRHHFGINQGPAMMMIENIRSECFWRLMQNCAPLVRGLRAAGFTNGWLA